MKNCGNGLVCQCCAAIQRAREQSLFDPLPDWGSPLTPGVQLVNLSESEDGRHLRIGLGRDWARMLGQLPLAGPGLVMTRNAGAILGRRMRYPALNLTSGGSKGASGEGGLWLDFRRFGAAWAVHLRRETGHVFGVEIADEAGYLVHRFTLTPESEMDEFFAWVRLHQACAAHRSAPWPEETEQAQPQQPARALRRSDAGAIVSIVKACVDRAMPMRVTVRGTGITQRVEFVPNALHPNDGWWFASDDATGLHFQSDAFPFVTVEEHAPEGGGKRAVLRAILEDDATALLLEAGSSAAEDAWQTLLQTTA